MIEARAVHTEAVMGTVASFDLRRAPDARAAIAAAMDLLHDIDRRFSTYRPDSEVNRVADGLDRTAWSDAMTEIVDRCEALRLRTDGYFAASASGRFDPSALVKGWAVQRAADLLVARGVHQFVVGAGGDLVVRGRPAPDERWRVGVQHPHDRGALAASFDAGDLAVATSGGYERGAHIRDPHTGAAAAGLVSVTVCGADLGEADALSTAAFAMGEPGARWLAEQAGIEAFCITADGRTLATAGFPPTIAMPVRRTTASTDVLLGLR